MNGPTDLTTLRRADVDAKQDWAGHLLTDIGCEGLLLLEPANFAWMTSGAVARGLFDMAERPVLYVSAQQRWLIASNLDAARLFDEELDGLGFQLKEWSWPHGRDQLLADLSHNRKLACDRGYRECKLVGDVIRQRRRALTAYEQTSLLALGRLTAHAIEATCRTLEAGQSEEEIAGQLSHRLLHHGVEPLVLQVAADGRGRRYRRCGATPAAVGRGCVIRAAAGKDGLVVAASRCVSFGPPDELFRAEFEAAARLSAVALSHTRPGTKAADATAAGRAFLAGTRFEHDWRQSPPGFVIGRTAAELSLVAAEPFQIGWAAAWHGTVGAATCGDTVLVMPDGPQLVTPTDDWPVKRIKIQGMGYDRPDLLVRG